MIEGRERELRMRIEQIKPWLNQRKAGGSGEGLRRMRKVIGRALLAWGSALIAEPACTERK
jgi:hypothetical protein